MSPLLTTKGWGEGQGEGHPTASLLHGQTPLPNPLPARSSRGEGAAAPVVPSRSARGERSECGPLLRHPAPSGAPRSRRGDQPGFSEAVSDAMADDRPATGTGEGSEAALADIGGQSDLRACCELDSPVILQTTAWPDGSAIWSGLQDSIGGFWRVGGKMMRARSDCRVRCKPRRRCR